MRYYVLAADYDGTLAHDGKVDGPTVDALKRLLESGRRLVLVTGRQIDELREVFPELDLFDWVAAENGALLYRPSSHEERPLAPPPPPEFLERLRRDGVQPLSVGRAIAATWRPHETAALAAIRDLGLEYQVIFNKGAVMILPSGINKASGLAAALYEMRLSPHNAVGVGDAENDHAFLSYCECAVAVANALPSIKRHVDWVTDNDHGAGVVQLIDRLLATDLAELAPKLVRHAIALGKRDDGRTVRLQPYGVNVLLAGTSGGGKSTLATGILERMEQRGYQYCIVDPEGDYENLGKVVVGGAGQRPPLEQVATLLEEPDEDVVVNLLGVAIEDRPRFFESLLAPVLELRNHFGRPHWLVLDEAHHLLPAQYHPAQQVFPAGLKGLILITVHPDHVLPALLKSVDIVLAIGANADETLRRVSQSIGEPPPAIAAVDLPPGDALVWYRQTRDAPFVIHTIPPRTERRRHNRKYAEGELGPERSFYFRGPHGRLNLRAQNLALFLQSAEGVDDDTWLYHLRRGDYSRWFHDVIKDPDLASAVARIERSRNPSPQQTRALIRDQVEQRYSGPA